MTCSAAWFAAIKPICVTLSFELHTSPDLHAYMSFVSRCSLLMTVYAKLHCGQTLYMSQRQRLEVLHDRDVAP